MDWDRKSWMSLLSKAGADAVLTRWRSIGSAPDFDHLRAPETGLVMTQGRIGGTGDAFNLGEMTVTRCSIRLSDGRIGHSYVAGRSKPHAEAAAIIDALMQGEEADKVSRSILQPMADEFEARKQEIRRKAAATKVNFFTMSRTAQVK